ncbi:MAG TPA: DUF4142 domain-containing protein [Vulgatibacter sp.]|nr:DUF4142 domain-containing protein [Vulgatibacter sp.]
MTTVSTYLRIAGLASVSLLVAAAGCASTPESAGADASSSSGLDDAQIAAIVTTANQIDVDNGSLAMERSSNPQVKQFAQRMMDDHTAVNQAAVDLVTRLGVTPEETETSRSLAASAQKTRSSMRSLSGAEFDKAYVDNEVAYHAAVIEVLDSTLIPSAQNEELKAMLVNVRPAFIAHLEHARSIQAALEGGEASEHAH